MQTLSLIITISLAHLCERCPSTHIAAGDQQRAPSGRNITQLAPCSNGLTRHNAAHGEQEEIRMHQHDLTAGPASEQDSGEQLPSS